VASLNKQSLREEFTALKERFGQLSTDGKVGAESRALIEALLMLMQVLIAVFIVMTSDWQRAITTRFQSIHQTLQVLLQIGGILLRCLTIDPHRTVFARALIGVPQPLGVEVMVQRRERHRWILCRQLGYPLLFR